MHKIFAVFDDTIKKSEVIEDVIGERGFADVVVKKRRLEEHYHEILGELFSDLTWNIMHSPYEINDLVHKLEVQLSSDMMVLHCFSNYIISDKDSASLTFKKIAYITDNYMIRSDGKVAALMFHNVGDYIKYLQGMWNDGKPVKITQQVGESIVIEGLVDIGIIGNFIQCITGDFDSRYFNSLQGNELTIVKSSSNKKKIRSEYEYWHLLPDDMKYWYVMPFNYQENETTASYTMERLHMTDLAIKWVHGSVDEEELRELLDKYFCFFANRHNRNISKAEYDSISKDLYEDKVLRRIDELKAHPQYAKLEKMLAVSQEENIDKIVEKYFALKSKIESMSTYPYVSVIGHGDPCFANVLYNKSTKMLKFIDPKGALTEEELWTNPYYDIAKLSHSICGCYDFFNNGLYDIEVNTNFDLRLKMDFLNENYKSIFKEKVEENGYDYLTVRIYEASLFISMLPLHIDNLHKVLGFILNVSNILKEIEENV